MKEKTVLFIKNTLYKRIRIHKTFKFTLYNPSSFPLYKEIIKTAFIYKTIKENLEYLEEKHIHSLINQINDFKRVFNIDSMFVSKNDFLSSERLKNANKSIFLIIELIIDKDIQFLYDNLKIFDRVELDDFFLEKRKEFYKRLILFKENLLEISTFIPKKKTNKINQFIQLIDEENRWLKEKNV